MFECRCRDNFGSSKKATRIVGKRALVDLYQKNEPSNKNLEVIFDSCLTFQSQNKPITQEEFFWSK